MALAPDRSVVIPGYNEESGLGSTVRDVARDSTSAVGREHDTPHMAACGHALEAESKAW
jgi:hypothetical protein